MNRIINSAGAAPIAVAALAAIGAAPAIADLSDPDWLDRADADQIRIELQLGADPSGDSDMGLPILAIAASGGNLDAIRIFVEEEGVDVGQRDEHGLTALHSAGLARNAPEVIGLLSDLGAEIDARDGRGRTPLYWAARDGNIQAMEALVLRGTDINALSDENMAPLHIAAKRAWLDVVEWLLDNGAAESGAMRSSAENGGLNETPYGFAVRAKSREMRNTRALERLKALSEGLPDPGPAPRGRTASAASPDCGGYVVRPSDKRLSLIAERALGDKSRWPEIARLNGLTGGKGYSAGDCLKLP